MRTRLQNPFYSVMIALGITLVLAVVAHAQPVHEPAPPAPPEPIVKDVAVAAPEETPKEVEVSDETPAVVTSVTVADEISEETPVKDSAEESVAELVAEGTKEEEAITEITVDAADVEVRVRHKHRHQNGFPLGNHTVPDGMVVREIVSIWGSSVLVGEAQKSVVSVRGDTIVKGRVRGEAVAILGNTTVEGEVGHEAVAVLGDTTVTGNVGREVVTVLGDAYIDGEVGGEIVVVLGNLTLGPDAVVNRGLTVVGGRIFRDDEAIVRGGVNQIQILGDDPDGARVDALRTWVRECFLMGRPLAFNSKVTWAWIVAISVLGFYILLTLMFPKPVEKCVETFEQRPGYSLLTVILAALMGPLLFIVLAATGIGAILLPFLYLGIFFGTLFGKAVILTWLGRRFTRYLGEGLFSHVSVAALVGGGLMLLLYTVPLVGFMFWKGLGLVGWGVVVYTLILKSRSNRPVASRSAAGDVAAVGAQPPLVAAQEGSTETMTPPELSLVTMPRAGFWIRFLASALDVILVAVVGALLHISALFVPLLGAYFVVMWALKGTTIGGIVCGLRVVRLDARPVDWSIAIVRSLSSFLSFFVVGLGFIWVAFDVERQSWHDKIAGTVVVRAPKGGSLI